MSQFCTQCGTQNIDEAMFCKSCGHPMENQETIHYSDSSPSSYSTTESTTAFHSSTIDDNEDINEPWSAWLLLIPIVIWFIYRVSVLKNGVALLFVPAGFAEMLGHAVPIIVLPLIITGIIYLSKKSDQKSYPNFMKHTFIGSMISLIIVIAANINSVNDEKKAVAENATLEIAPTEENVTAEAAAPTFITEADQMEQQCDKGWYGTCVQLGKLYENGQGVIQNSYTAAGLYRKACDGGFADGCFNLGLLYGFGKGILQDYYQAKVWYQKACDLGNAVGCNNLGVMYENGQGGATQDSALALKFYKQACDGNDGFGCNNLGAYYYDGVNINQDYSKSLKLFKKACSLGNQDGCNNVAKAEKALFDSMPESNHLQYECDRGNAKSCNDLGVSYDNGEDVEQNSVKAAALYRKACDRGNAEGCSNLALDYATGTGVNPDNTKRKIYFKKACRLGDSDACDRVNAY